jgi:glycosyltransferase involved in cell wall biosynthesis
VTAAPSSSVAETATVGVIVPVLNGARFLDACLSSIRGQGLTAWEGVVVDDGSTDGSAAIAARHASEDPRLRLIRQSNRGVWTARNVGENALARAPRYLAFFDADDVMEPDCLEVFARYLDARADVDAVFCSPRIIDEDGAALPIVVDERGWLPRWTPSALGIRALRDDEPDTPFESVWSFAGAMPSVTMIRRSAFQRAGGWRSAADSVYEDSDLMLRIVLAGKLHYLPRQLVRHRQHANQTTVRLRSIMPDAAKRFHEKWRRDPTLSPPQRALVERAHQFFEYRYIPSVGLGAASRHFRAGHLLEGTRFTIGAARRLIAGYAGEMIGTLKTRAL